LRSICLELPILDGWII